MRAKLDRPTLKQMAQKLGVSTATVSNAFNRPSQLSSSLREKILRECMASGYAGPNAAARSLRTGRTGIVGVMLSNYLSYSFSDPVAQQFLQGLAEVFEESEYSILVMPSRDRLKKVHGYESFVDGFIVYGPPQHLTKEQLKQQGKSVIAVDCEIEGYTSVRIDDYEGAFKIAQHALSSKPAPVAILGIRLVAADSVCSIEDENLFSADRIITVHRLNGFVDAANEAGVEIPQDRIFHVPDNTHGNGYEAARLALARNPRPRLLLCMSDRIALAAIAAARDIGLRVPEDVLVTGFDDIPESETHHPALTTIHQQSTDKGRIAAEMFQGKRLEKDTVLSTELVVRESCP